MRARAVWLAGVISSTATIAAYAQEPRLYTTTSDLPYCMISVLPPASLRFWTIFLFILLAGCLAYLLLSHAKNTSIRKKEKEELYIRDMKLKMFTDLSHEIRTPLTLIMSPLKKFRETEEDPKKKELFNLMYKNALRILRLVNQVTDIQKIDDGQMSMHFCKTSQKHHHPGHHHQGHHQEQVHQ